MTRASFRESIAWQRAMELSQVVYQLTRSFPKEELFGLSSQLRRSAVSVASNIAGGQGRITTGEFLQFLGIARGSALEVETQLEVALREGYGPPDMILRAEALAEEVVRILNASIATTRERRKRQRSASAT
ncbi:four helix bundle protein [Bryocella elongata]|uniref:Four helix bundle protein n=1 Tax=Bryocella elongata TaxID=863522 RepID=A0A1H5Y9U5_9BACT|nr:four helix bundle protein [Bryocella elongata]SEG20859.1 four helix bundle protein [Bryocella elongata]